MIFFSEPHFNNNKQSASLVHPKIALIGKEGASPNNIFVISLTSLLGSALTLYTAMFVWQTYMGEK